MPKKTVVIPGVTLCKQGDTDLLVFVLDAKTLIEIGTPLRFGRHPLGVNRALTYHRVKAIVKYMREKKGALMIDPIQGCLYSGGDEDSPDWVYDPDAHTLTGTVIVDEQEGRITDGCFFSIDDGQHRWTAITLLSEEQREGCHFFVQVGRDMTVERRTELFLQRELRKAVDTRLKLQMMDRLDAFPNEAHKRAYRAAKMLNEHTSSPLNGHIFLDQGSKVPRDKVSVTSIMGTLKFLAGKKSRIGHLSVNDQQEAILNLFVAASQQWGTTWGRPDKTLGKKLGYLTLLVFLAKSGNLHAVLDRDYTIESFKHAFGFCRGFRWEQAGTRDGSISYNELMRQLDEHMGMKITEAQHDAADAPKTGTHG